jgi:formylglycine-generating enzyme required for sulfatase activity
VPALRQWLTRKQRETWRGRAALRLAERATLWNAKRENRQLPAWWEWVNIRALTQRSRWTVPQQAMMRKAGRFHGVRGLLLAIVVALVTVGGLIIIDARDRRSMEQNRLQKADSLVREVVGAKTDQVLGIIARMENYRAKEDYRERINQQLRKEYQAAARAAAKAINEAEKTEQETRRLHASLALLAVDGGHLDDLYHRLLAAQPHEVTVIIQALDKKHGRRLRSRLWRVVEHPPKGQEDQLLRAAAALARYDPQSERWQKHNRAVVEQLVAVNPIFLERWLEAFRPVRERLMQPLADVCRDIRAGRQWDRDAGGYRKDRPERIPERRLAASILADYAADRPALLADLLMDVDAKQFAVLFPILNKHRKAAIKRFLAELRDDKLRPAWHDPPLNPAWKKPAPELAQKISAGFGIIHERFAFTQTMPLDEFLRVADALGRCGYRPVRFRPYAVGDRVQVAALWTRDELHWRLTHDSSAQEVRDQDAKFKMDGFQPCDVAGYLRAGKERYAALWVERANRAGYAQLYVGLSEKEHRKLLEQPLEARQYGLWQPPRETERKSVTLQVLVGADGQTRYNSVWRRTVWGGGVCWDEDEEAHALREESDGLEVDVNLSFRRPDMAPFIAAAHGELFTWLHGPPNPILQACTPILARVKFRAWLSGSSWARPFRQGPMPPHPERRYAGCFLSQNNFSHVTRLGLTPKEQVRRCRDLLDQGFRPAALSVAVFPAPRGRHRAAPDRVPFSACVWHRPCIPDRAKERLAKRRANAAVALLRLGQADHVWPLLKHEPMKKPDPRLRSYLIHRLRPLGAQPGDLLRELRAEPEVSIRRALLLVLGEFAGKAGDFADQSLAEGLRNRIVAEAEKLYGKDPDAGVHGAAAWLLRRYGQDSRGESWDHAAAGNRKADAKRQADIRVALRRRGEQAGPRWYLTGQAQTMVVVPRPQSGGFRMGSPRTEAGRLGGNTGKQERPHRQGIPWTFAIGATEVTVVQFTKFCREFGLKPGHNPMYAWRFDCPMNQVSWYDAAAYCRWLSEKEGVPPEQMCYPPVTVIQRAARTRKPLPLPPDYLARTGYRLPTEAEWEFACRAGAVTSRYYGETEELLPEYAWYTKNSEDRQMQPVGRLKPNDLGLFDMLGNAVEWCEGPRLLYLPALHRHRLIHVPALRGGMFNAQGANARCARYYIHPANWSDNVTGFRIARRFP